MNETMVALADATPSGELAWHEARRRAARSGGRVVVTRTIPSMVGANMLFPQCTRAQIEEAAVVRAEALADLERLAAAAGDVETRVVLGEGEPATAVVRAAEACAASLVVIGDAAPRPGARMGMIADRVIRHAHCAVLVVRPTPPTGIIFGGTDFSDAALPVVTALGREASARVGGLAVLVHVLDPLPWFDAAPYLVPHVAPSLGSSELETARQAAMERLAHALDARGVVGERVVVQGGAGPALVAAATAADAEMIVVGTVGRSGLPRLLLGNVAEYVVRHARCSVMVLRLHR